MASYNSMTGKIEDATPGTLAYRHELRHKWQDEHGLLKLETQAAFFFPGAAVILLFFFPLVPITIEAARSFILTYFLYIVGLELDAWIYSLTHK